MAREPLLLALVAAVVVLLLVGAYRVSGLARRLHGKEMTLLDHLRELRYRAIAIIATGGGAAVLAFTLDARRAHLLGRDLWLPAFSVKESIASRALDRILSVVLPPDVQVVVLTPFEAVSATIQASLIVGLLAASPFIAYHIAAFLAPALHARERRTLALVAPFSLVLFLGGALFSTLVVVPTALTFLYAFSETLGAAPLARPGDILSFVGLTALLLGAAFQLPLVMTLLSRVGMVQPATFARHWRGVIVATLIIAAIVTPDPTVTSQLLVAVPTLALYFLGIGLAYAVRPRK